MQKLGILASIILLTAAVVGPIGFSFAQESVNATSVETSSDTDKKTETTPQKEMPMEEKIQAHLAEIKAKRETKMDDRTIKMKEKALKKSITMDERLEQRMKQIEIAKGKKDAQLKDQEEKIKQKMAQNKAKLDERLKKKTLSAEERLQDAKAKFDKKMADKMAKFNAKVKLKSKTLAQEKSESETSMTDSAESGSDTGSNSTGTQ